MGNSFHCGKFKERFKWLETLKNVSSFTDLSNVITVSILFETRTLECFPNADLLSIYGNNVQKRSHKSQIDLILEVLLNVIHIDSEFTLNCEVLRCKVDTLFVNITIWVQFLYLQNTFETTNCK